MNYPTSPTPRSQPKLQTNFGDGKCEAYTNDTMRYGNGSNVCYSKHLVLVMPYGATQLTLSSKP